MSEGPTFPELIGRVRAGDEAAAAELVRRYEPAIRRAVRYRLVDPRLRRVCDTMDICQSVMVSFFVRAASGQYELDTPEQLLKLLAIMARNKLSKQAHKQRAACRDNRSVSPENVEQWEGLTGGVDPGQQVAARELLQEVHRRLSPDERQLVELRNQGHGWNDIAEQVGGSPEALRKKLSRAIARLTQELGLDDADAG
jgi:RNA polymerase sigma factor (sigma-70 family)